MNNAQRIKNWQHPHIYMGKWYQNKGKIQRIIGVIYNCIGGTNFITNKDSCGWMSLENLHNNNENFQLFNTKKELLESLNK